MKKNLRKLATMGAIALSLSTGFTPVLGTAITAYATEDPDYISPERLAWARNYEDAKRNDGSYSAENIGMKVTATHWQDDIRDIEKGRLMNSPGSEYIATYTRMEDGRIKVLSINDENLNDRYRMDWTYDDCVNDLIGQIEKFDNKFSHTYIPVTIQRSSSQIGYIAYAHYDRARSNNDPIAIYRDYEKTGGYDNELQEELKSSSSNGGSGSSGGSSSSHKVSDKSNSGSLTGWVSTSDGWMYQIDGVDATGWVNAGGTWYFMNNAGIMQTGWVLSNGKWYYMNTNGSMATGWVNTNGKWYFLNGAGDMATGWVLSNGKWYYLDSDGHMLSNTTVGNYRLDASGAWIQ